MSYSKNTAAGANLLNDWYSVPRPSLPNDNDIQRIRNRLDNGATAAEIAEEAYRLCRINAYLRKDLQWAEEELGNVLDKKKEAVKDDALVEMKQERRESRNILRRIARYLKYKKLDLPFDIKHAFENALKHDEYGPPWERTGIFPYPTERHTRKSNKEFERKDQIPFLLHTPEGETVNMRKRVVPEYDDGGEEGDIMFKG